MLAGWRRSPRPFAGRLLAAAAAQAGTQDAPGWLTSGAAAAAGADTDPIRSDPIASLLGRLREPFVASGAVVHATPLLVAGRPTDQATGRPSGWLRSLPLAPKVKLLACTCKALCSNASSVDILACKVNCYWAQSALVALVAARPLIRPPQLLVGAAATSSRPTTCDGNLLAQSWPAEGRAVGRTGESTLLAQLGKKRRRCFLTGRRRRRCFLLRQTLN